MTDVEAGEAAEDAGLQPGDLIVSVNGNPVDGVDAFEAEIAKAKADGLARLACVAETSTIPGSEAQVRPSDVEGGRRHEADRT